MARILIIEDEPDLQTLLRFNLAKDGHQVAVAGTGNDGLHELRRNHYELVLLDLMLPDRDGLDVCRIIRSDEALAGLPVIMVTAKGEESDVVIGLGLGADDYVVKPFRIKELLARIRVRLARSREESADAERRRLQFSGLVIDPVRHRVLIDDEPAPLTLTEFKLLHVLAMKAGTAYARYDLLDRIGDGDTVVTDRTIDAHVRNLRRKISPYGHFVETVRGVGYRFSERALATDDVDDDASSV
jgi:two-component system, OmpR family, alkaline phosphatase synthesis response regulator PhoP